MDKPQIITHIHKSLNNTGFDVKWIPYSARFIVIGSTPKSSGVLQIYELNGQNVDLQKEIVKPKAFKCGTFQAASTQQRNLATGDFDGNLNIWDLERTDAAVYSAKAHHQIINSIDGIGGLGKGNGAPELVTGGRDGAVRVWDPRQKDEAVANMEPAKGTEARDCWTVAFGNSYNNEERCVCSGYDNGDIKLFDLRAMKILWETNVSGGICCLEFNRKDIKMDKLIATTLDSKYHLFDLSSELSKTGFPSLTQAAHKGTVWTVKHTPNNRSIFATTGGSGSVALWKYSSSTSSDNKVGSIKLLNDVTIATQPISAFDWSPDKSGLAVCASFDQAVRVILVTKLNLL